MKVVKLSESRYCAPLVIKAGEIAPRTIRFVASDESVDRDGDIILSSGWDLKNFLKNPTILYAHNSWGYPVGKAVKAYVDEAVRALIIDVYFPKIEELCSDASNPSEIALASDTVYHMALLGLLNTGSVGFIALERVPSQTGYVFQRQELLEFSIVPVPANPNAVSILREHGVGEKGIHAIEEEKSGRRLSARTLEQLNAIKEAHKALHETIARMDEPLRVLLEPEDDEDDEEEDGCGDEDKPKGVVTILHKSSGLILSESSGSKK